MGLAIVVSTQAADLLHVAILDGQEHAERVDAPLDAHSIGELQVDVLAAALDYQRILQVALLLAELLSADLDVTAGREDLHAAKCHLECLAACGEVVAVLSDHVHLP